jgi:hypothetical protein
MKVSNRTVIASLLLLFASGLAAAGDKETLLSLLKKYSPDGYYIVDTYEKKAEGSDFMEYWDASSEDARWDSYNTIVHETAHGVMAALAKPNSLFIPASRASGVMVPLTETFFSREMVDTFPKELRTFRFGTYVDCSQDDLGSQALGAYGLLDEMTAYYLGTKASWDLLPHFEAQGAAAPWSSFFQAVNGTLYGILEFKLYTLKYLMFAEKKHPEVYRKIMANRDFSSAFLAVDAAANAFFRDYFAGKERVYESLRKSGLTAKEDGDYLVIGKSGKEICNGSFREVYSLLAAELEKKEYRNLMQLLNAGKAVASTPTTPVPAPTASPAATPASAPTKNEPMAVSTGGLNIGRDLRPAVEATEALRAEREAAAKKNPVASPKKPAAVSDSRTEAQARSAASAIADIHGPAKGGRGAAALLTRSAVDERGDAGKEYLDITRADVALFADQLVVGISFVSFPGMLLFNAPDLEENMLEYEWSCAIDLEGEGTDEYLLSLSAFKAPGSRPVEASVTLFCQTSLWKLSASGGESVEAKAGAEIAGSALFLTLADGAGLPLKKMTSKTRFTVKTYRDEGKGGTEDSLGL